jgi:hypothetical protein
VERNVELDIGQHLRKQPNHRFTIARAIEQNFPTLFVAERPALHDPGTHVVLAFAANAVEPVVGKRAEEALTGWHGAAVSNAAKFGAEVEDVGRQRPVQGEMATQFRVADEADK